jgi:serpin B
LLNSVDSQSNQLIAPFNIHYALAQVSLGARGETKAELESLLGGSGDAFLLALSQVNAKLETQTQDLTVESDSRMWIQRNYPIAQEFLDGLLKQGGRERSPGEADFLGDMPGAILAINKDAEERTHGKIQNLVKDLNPNTRFALITSAYFDGKWNATFTAEDTKRDFHFRDGTKTQVPMMSVTETLGIYRGQEWSAVDVPYVGHEFAMTIIVPIKDALKLDASELTKMWEHMFVTRVALTMPKWNFMSEFALATHLKALGLKSAFDLGKADFTGINLGIEPLALQNVTHAAKIDVDERGTVASASTAVTSFGCGALPEASVFVVDKPFYFAIRHVETNTLLFLGRVQNPSIN